MPFLLDPLPWHSVARKFFVLLRLSALLVAILTVDVFSVSLYGFFKVHFSPAFFLLASGDGEIRTLDPLLARQVLSQLSYAPVDKILFAFCKANGLKWTRTTDLTLIRRAL